MHAGCQKPRRIIHPYRPQNYLRSSTSHHHHPNSKFQDYLSAMESSSDICTARPKEGYRHDSMGKYLLLDLRSLAIVYQQVIISFITAIFSFTGTRTSEGKISRSLLEVDFDFSFFLWFLIRKFQNRHKEILKEYYTFIQSSQNPLTQLHSAASFNQTKINQGSRSILNLYDHKDQNKNSSDDRLKRDLGRDTLLGVRWYGLSGRDL
ncbi:hypothetical protein ABKN59_003387 [Abortiporus biennis]